MMPDKIYFDGVDTALTPRLSINEVYIRKDALLEWLDKCIKRRDGSFAADHITILAYKNVIDKVNSL